jgi:TonB family protein
MSHFSKHYPLPFAITLFCSAGGHVFLVVALLVLGLIPVRPHTRYTWLDQSVRVQVHTPGPPIKGASEKPLGVKRVMDIVNAQPPKPRATPAPAPAPKPETPKDKIVLPSKEAPKPTHKTPEESQKKKIISVAPTVKATPRKELPLPSIPSSLDKGSGKDTRGADAGPSRPLPPLPSVRDYGGGGPAPLRKGDPNGSSGSSTGQLQTDGNVFLPYDYGSDAQGRIQANFSYPSSLKSRGNATCVLRFRIHRNGMIDTIEVLQSTGQSRLDDFAKQALIQTQSLLPLPDTVKQDSIFVTVPFSFGEEGR